jgi:S-formylglutathione hydrolase FrmB
MRRLESHACFGGTQDVWAHDATSTSCEMRVSVFLPPQANSARCPVLYVLSGLTCTEQNFIQKSGAQRYAAEHGLILVGPDTSPRGAGVPDAEGDDIGLSAGFYVDATQVPWSAQYRMHAYVTQELPALIEAAFPANDVRGITGHSMGGHGALICALRNPGRYRSVSALAPICSASRGWAARPSRRISAKTPTRGAHGMRAICYAIRTNTCSSWSTKGMRIRSCTTSCCRISCATPAPTADTRSTCACARATTMASTSSPPSSATTSRITSRR